MMLLLYFSREEKTLTFAVRCWNALQLKEVEKDLHLRTQRKGVQTRKSSPHVAVGLITFLTGVLPETWPPETSCRSWRLAGSCLRFCCLFQRAEAKWGQKRWPDCAETSCWCSRFQSPCKNKAKNNIYTWDTHKIPTQTVHTGLIFQSLLITQLCKL